MVETTARSVSWPDWSSDTVAIIASGPSTTTHDLGQLRELRVLVIGQNVELYPNADAVYSCDGNWWHWRDGLSEFNGWKFTNDGTAASRYGLRKINVRAQLDELLFRRVGEIGGGGCSGFQALNLTLQFGARSIVLIGFDMNDDDKRHWYGRNSWAGSHNPSRRDFARWRRALDAARYDKRCLIVNASERSTLRSYPKMTLRAALECLNGFSIGAGSASPLSPQGHQ